MKITITNKRATGGDAVQAMDGTQVAPGAQHTINGATPADLVFQMGVADADVSVVGQMDAVDRAIIICDMKDVADPGSGVGSVAGEGFDLKDQAGAAAGVAPQMYMGVFDDADCKVPAANATLDTAGTGTIDSGAGTNLLKVTPDSAGEFDCTLTDAEDETVYLKAWPVGTDYVVDASDSSTTVFSP